MHIQNMNYILFARSDKTKYMYIFLITLMEYISLEMK